MRNMLFVSLLCAGLALTAQSLDPGGVTVDLTQAGIVPVVGDSLLRNGDMEALEEGGAVVGWTRDAYVWLPGEDPAAQNALLRRVRPSMRWANDTAVAVDGQRALFLALPAAAHLPEDPAPHEYCPFWRQSVLFDAAVAGRTYVLTYSYRGKSVPGFRNSQGYVRVSFFDAPTRGQGTPTRVYAQTLLVPTDRWRDGQLAFSVPQDTRRLDVRLALRNCGEVRFDRVALHRARGTDDAKISVRFMPWDLIGGDRYCLASGSAGTFVFGFRNENNVPIDHPQLVVRLPGFIELVDLDRAARVVDEEDVEDGHDALREYRIDISAWRNRIRGASFQYPYNMWQGLTLLVRTSHPPGAQRHRAVYWVEDGDYRSAQREFRLEVVEPFATAPQPLRFRSGVHLFLVPQFTTPAGVKAFAELYRRTGLNAVHVPPSALGTELGRVGIERYTQPFANGYTLGDATPGKKPDDAVFRLVDGQPLWAAICPVEVYTRGAYFRSAIRDGMLRRILLQERSAEQIMTNWEPFMYNGKGCFCARCKDEFRKHSGLPLADVDRVWPDTVLQEHGDAWIKFRSWQHGRLMAVIADTVHDLGKEAGLDSRFIPEVAYRLLTEFWDDRAGHCEFAAIDYVADLSAFTPWGPYNWHVFGRGAYDHVRGQHLNCHASAREVLRFLDARLAAGKRPKLFAFPYGTYEGATQPEAIAFEMLTYFVNRYDGAFVYLFPGGYDARYWAALADMNRAVAAVEETVMQGVPARGHRLTPRTPLPKPDPRFLSAGGCLQVDLTERWQELPLLLSWEFRKGAKRLIAVGNFWERGECFFELQLEGLDGNRDYVLREPVLGRVYSGDDGRVARSGAELAEGVLLHIGALRYAFFVIEPRREDADVGPVLSQRDMQDAMRQRLPVIRAQYERETAP